RELCLLALIPGCSLVLDFSDKAIPKDAMTDAPYTADECAYKEPNDSFDTATSVTFAIQFTNRPGGDLDLELLDSTGTQKAISRGFGDGETIVCPGSA